MRLVFSQKKLLLVFLLFVLIDIFFIIFYFNPVLLQRLMLFLEPQPGSCLILEEKYCRQAQVVYYKEKAFAVGFSLPEGAPVFAPFGGIFANSGSMGIRETGENYPSISIATDIQGDYVWDAKKHFKAVFFREEVRNDEERVKIGDVVGKVSAKPIEFFSPHNLIVYFSSPNDEGFLRVDRKYTLNFFGL